MFNVQCLMFNGKLVPLHPLKKDDGPFVYRLGREIFIL